MNKSTFETNPHRLALPERLWDKYKNSDYTGVKFNTRKVDFGEGEIGIEFIFETDRDFYSFLKIISEFK
jgi:hypothetical protein